MKNFSNIKNISIKKAFWLTLGALVLALVIYNSKDLIFGTRFDVVAINDGATLTDQFLLIKGSAKHAKSLQINGRNILFDRSGNFLDGVLLSPGYNIVEVSLEDQFNNKKTKVYHLVFDAPPTVASKGEVNYQ